MTVSSRRGFITAAAATGSVGARERCTCSSGGRSGGEDNEPTGI